MEPKLIFATLGVVATIMLGNGVPALAVSDKTETKSQVTVAETTTTKEEAVKTAEPEVKAEEVITVQSGDTLESIATAHNTTYVRLFNANPGITNPDVIDVGNQITIPAAEKELEDRFSQLAPVAPAAATTTTYTTKKYSSAPANSSSYYVGNGMWCTDYVHSKRPDVAIYGNAGYNWISSAQAAGKSTGSTPQPGAVAVMDGHVAYVESVNGDGSYVVSEMGWNYEAGNYNQRTVQPGAFGSFIY